MLKEKRQIIELIKNTRKKIKILTNDISESKEGNDYINKIKIRIKEEINKCNSDLNELVVNGRITNQNKKEQLVELQKEVSSMVVTNLVDKKQKLSVVCNNIFNSMYSLRPLKIESPRNTAIQYVLTF